MFDLSGKEWEDVTFYLDGADTTPDSSMDQYSRAATDVDRWAREFEISCGQVANVSKTLHGAASKDMKSWDDVLSLYADKITEELTSLMEQSGPRDYTRLQEDIRAARPVHRIASRILALRSISDAPTLWEHVDHNVKARIRKAARSLDVWGEEGRPSSEAHDRLGRLCFHQDGGMTLGHRFDAATSKALAKAVQASAKSGAKSRIAMLLYGSLQPIYAPNYLTTVACEVQRL
jgi:hypothetical protein